jgi:hypothetical protein
MTNRAQRIGAVIVALALAGSGSALAAGAMNGKSYEGVAPSWGVDHEGHKQRTRASGKIVLRVAGSGRSVTVRFTSSSPVLYCNSRQHLQVQSTNSASISKAGTFKASVAQRFSKGPGLPGVVQVVTGKFSGRNVSGTIRTQAGECSGVAHFSATAR